jgi:hypothetical protein
MSDSRFVRCMRRLAIAIAAALTTVACVGQAGADDKMSGPAIGSAVPPLMVFAATGPHAGKNLDFSAERGDRPTVYLLIREFDRPVARFMKALDVAVPQESAEAHVVAAWCTDQREKTKEYLPRAQQSLKFEATSLTVATGDANGPNDWLVNPNVRVTVVVSRKKKVTATFGFVSINETSVREVRQALKKAVEEP